MTFFLPFTIRAELSDIQACTDLPVLLLRSNRIYIFIQSFSVR